MQELGRGWRGNFLDRDIDLELINQTNQENQDSGKK